MKNRTFKKVIDGKTNIGLVGERRNKFDRKDTNQKVNEAYKSNIFY